MTRHTDPRLIEASLAANRKALSDTLGAIQARIAPEKLMQDAWSTLRQQAGRFAQSADRAVRANPWAFAVTGLGIGWAVFGTKHKKLVRPAAAEDTSRWEDEGGSPPPDHIDDEPAQITGKANPLHSVRAQAARQVDDMPLIFGAAALLIGAAIGATLTRTRLEDRVFGSESDRFHVKTAEILRTEQHRLRELASEVTQTIADGLRDSLTAATGELSDTIDKVGDQVRADLEKT